MKDEPGKFTEENSFGFDDYSLEELDLSALQAEEEAADALSSYAVEELVTEPAAAALPSYAVEELVTEPAAAALPSYAVEELVTEPAGVPFSGETVLEEQNAAQELVPEEPNAPQETVPEGQKSPQEPMQEEPNAPQEPVPEEQNAPQEMTPEEPKERTAVPLQRPTQPSPPTEEPAEKPRKRRAFPWKKVLAAAAGLAIAGGAAAYGYGIHYYGSRFLPGTYIDGTLVENLTPAEAQEAVTRQNAAEDTRFTVLSKTGESETIDLSKAGLVREYRGLEQILHTQDRLMFLPQKDLSKFPECSYVIKIGDPAAFRQAVMALPMADPQKTQPPLDAVVTLDPVTDLYSIVPETEGNTVEPEALVKAVQKAVESSAHALVLTAEDPEGIYKKPAVTAQDETLNLFADRMNSLHTIGAKIDLGADTVLELPPALIRHLLIPDCWNDPQAAQVIDRAAFDSYISVLDSTYSTKPANGIKQFTGIKGNVEEVPATYGWAMDTGATGGALYVMLDEAVRKRFTQPDLTEQNPDHVVKAVWTQEALSHEKGRDIGNTWAEVDLANQKMYLAVDGQLVLESDVVTGKGADPTVLTPPGYFKVTFKTTNRDLVGYNPDGTESYRSHVNYWMPFNRNIGFHDATWRGSFGGNIHTSSGSHGCVNMPLANAKTLYSYIYKNMPVIVYAGTKAPGN